MPPSLWISRKNPGKPEIPRKAAETTSDQQWWRVIKSLSNYHHHHYWSCMKSAKWLSYLVNVQSTIILELGNIHYSYLWRHCLRIVRKWVYIPSNTGSHYLFPVQMWTLSRDIINRQINRSHRPRTNYCITSWSKPENDTVPPNKIMTGPPVLILWIKQLQHPAMTSTTILLTIEGTVITLWCCR